MAVRERTKQKGKPQRCCLRKSASHKVNLVFVLLPMFVNVPSVLLPLQNSRDFKSVFPAQRYALIQ